jgi:hypothetical protein
MKTTELSYFKVGAARGRGLGILPLLPMVLAASLAHGVVADAGEAGRGGWEDDGWTFGVSPYLWAAGIEGTTGTLPGLPPAEVDQSFSDIFDDLRFAGMVLGSARKGRLGVAGGLQYVKSSAESNALAPLFGREKLTSESLILDLMGEYVAYEDERSVLRLAGGARLWSVDTELELAGGLLPGRVIEHDETWVDPLVGVSGSIDVGARTFLRGWGFVGGFGVGSDIMADLFGGVGYRFTDSISGTLGYRWMKVDYDKDDFLYDVRQEGILAGMTFRF